MRLSLAAAVIAFLPFVPIPARAEVFPIADEERGIVTTEAQCKAVEMTLWLRVDNHDFCVRYYLSTVGGTTGNAVIFLNGDPGCKLDIRKLTCMFPSTTRPWNAAQRQRLADDMSRQFGTPAIYLARVGQDGTSGYVAWVHTRLELDLANASVSALKARYHYSKVELFGHSGGAGLVGALFGLRSDIDCDVVASGGMHITRTDPAKLCVNGQSCDPLLLSYDPEQELAAMVRNKAAHLWMVTDARDEHVPLEKQQPFVEELQHAGGKVDQIFVDIADDPAHHFDTPEGRVVMKDCLANTPFPQVEADVAASVAQRLKVWAAKAVPPAPAAPDADADEPGAD